MQTPEEAGGLVGVGLPGAGTRGSCELLEWVLGMNVGPLEELDCCHLSHHPREKSLWDLVLQQSHAQAQGNHEAAFI